MTLPPIAVPRAAAGTAAPLGCPACATPVVPGGRFCFACGIALDADAVAAATGGAGAERRVVTVLFADLSDFTSWAEDLDPERVGVVTDRMLAAATKAVTDVGGSVDKLTGDGIMAVFGAPTAHEDDAVRAVRAAAAMQAAVQRLVDDESGGGRQLGLRVGLNTGEVLAGMQAALSYTVVGDTVNTAARLSDAAGVGTVYAGRETALTTADVATWRALTPLRLKGKRELVAAYELVELRPARAGWGDVGEQAPFIGREAELGRLRGRLSDVVDRGQPATVLVIGEAGVGKTRLVRELCRAAAELPSSRVLWGRCRPYGEGRDLAPLLDMIRTACGLPDPPAAPGSAETVVAARAEAARRVRRTVARMQRPLIDARPSVLADRLLSLLGWGAPVLAQPRSAAPGAVGSRRPDLDAAAGLFSALAADGPLVLVVDDLNWASAALFDALRQVAVQLRGEVLVVAAGRPESLQGQVHWPVGLPAPELLTLKRMPDPAADRLLRAYLGGGTLDPAGHRLLLRRAEGNPFFLAELVHLLIDRGLLRQDGTTWMFDADARAETLSDVLGGEVLPAGVQAVLAARIDDLSSPVRTVLRDAAVVGARFPAQALQVLGQPVGTADVGSLAVALDVLLERQLIRRGSDGTYRFAHTLVRDVAYAGVSKVDRAQRHAAIARWGGEAGRNHLPDLDAFVAGHAERAVGLAVEMRLADDDAAWAPRAAGFEALVRLGQAALARDDNVTAESRLARALALAGGPGPGSLPPAALRGVRVAHGRALAGLHRLAEAEAELADALPSADAGLRAEALLVLGDVYRRRGADDAATEAFDRALAAAGDAGQVPTAAAADAGQASTAGQASQASTAGEALRQLGLLDYFNGRLRAAEGRFRQARELASQVGDGRGVGWALQHLAWSAVSRGDYATAEAALQEAAGVFAELNDVGGLGWCRGTEAFVRLLQGRLGEARRLAGALVTAGKASGDRFGVAACLTIDAFAAAELGDIQTARGEAERARRDFAATGDLWGQSLALVAAGVAARGDDEPTVAIQLLDQAVTLSESGRHPLTAFLARVVMGYCQLDRQDADAAREQAVLALALLDDLDLEPAAVVGGQVLLARVLRARGEVPEALHLLRAATASPATPSLLFPRRQALAHLAGALLECGLVEEAHTVALRAVREPAEDVRSRTVSLRVLGAVLISLGDVSGAVVALTTALQAARSTGQRSEIAATERALAGVSRQPT
jgi:class 3 adenylate cyclase/predicted ATPase